MNTSIIDEFFAEDCDTSIQRMLIEDIESCSEKNVVREYTFNRFNVRISFEDSLVLVEDDLMISEEGECKVNLAEFEARLRNISPKN